jgi:hypothetical protein
MKGIEHLHALERRRASVWGIPVGCVETVEVDI